MVSPLGALLLKKDFNCMHMQATMRTIPCTSGRQKVICATNVNGQTCDGDSGSAVVGELHIYLPIQMILNNWLLFDSR